MMQALRFAVAILCVPSCHRGTNPFPAMRSLLSYGRDVLVWFREERGLTVCAALIISRTADTDHHGSETCPLAERVTRFLFD